MNARAQTDVDDIGAIHANMWQTCGIKLEMVMVTVTAILIDSRLHMERLRKLVVLQ